MRVIVCGSRGWTDAAPIYDRLSKFPPGTFIIHGGAKGADIMADRIALALGLPVEVHLANWNVHGRRAGIIRNEEMALAGADLCLAFWDGQSRGTRDMIDRAGRHGISVEITEYGGREDAAGRLRRGSGLGDDRVRPGGVLGRGRMGHPRGTGGQPEA